MLDVVDALCSHYGEPILVLLREWSWKLFCARWRRLIAYTAEQRAQQEQRERDQAFADLRAKTGREHSARLNSSSY